MTISNMMKKINILFLSLLFFAACQPKKTAESIKNEIFNHKEAIKSLEIELSQLDKTAVHQKAVKVIVQEAKKSKVKHSFQFFLFCRLILLFLPHHSGCCFYFYLLGKVQFYCANHWCAGLLFLFYLKSIHLIIRLFGYLLL